MNCAGGFLQRTEIRNLCLRCCGRCRRCSHHDEPAARWLVRRRLSLAKSRSSGIAYLGRCLFLPFGRNREQQAAARRDTKQRSKIAQCCEDGARCGNIQHTAVPTRNSIGKEGASDGVLSTPSTCDLQNPEQARHLCDDRAAVWVHLGRTTNECGRVRRR
jgi:hypothetical protein